MNVGVLETKNRLSELIEAARRGEDVVITNRGEPVARIVSVEPAADRKARALAALDEADQLRQSILERSGRLFTWEELKEDRDFGRP